MIQKRLRSITGGVFKTPDEEKNSDWLPDGWVVEINYKNSGMKFKVIINFGFNLDNVIDVFFVDLL